jgi:chorismate synthase
VLTCVCFNVPVGLGEPCFDKLSARLAYAMMSLPAAKGFEMGAGFSSPAMRGSTHNDAFVPHPPASTRSNAAAPVSAAVDATTGTIGPDSAPGKLPALRTRTNYSGGTLGGISTGANLVFRVAIKPVSTIGLPQVRCCLHRQHLGVGCHPPHVSHWL